MTEKRTWIIIEMKTEKAIFGLKNVTMRFSTREVALEVAECLFANDNDYLITQVIDKL